MRKLIVRVLLVLTVLLVALPCVSQAKIVSISTGLNYALALDDDGTVWAWGTNTYGQLGDGTADAYRKVPAKVHIDNVKAVSAGGAFNLALKNDGTVWAWGYGTEGQLGYGGTDTKSEPVQVQGLSGVVAIAAGSLTGFALKSDGTVWAWGCNNYGQIGDGSMQNQLVPVQINGLTDMKALCERGDFAIKDDGTVWTWGDPGSGTTLMPLTPYNANDLTDVREVSIGGYQAIYVKNDGTVWAWGSNRYGALGDGTITNDDPYDFKTVPVQISITDVKTVSTDSWHSIALKNDGTVWTWGEYVDGRVINDGRGSPVPVQVSSLGDVIDVSAGSHHFLALKSDGSIWGWGTNNNYVLGDHKELEPKPVLIFTAPESATPAPTVSAQPSVTSMPEVTPDPTISVTPTPVPNASSVPAPGFWFGTIGMLCCLLFVTGIVSVLKSNKKR